MIKKCVCLNIGNMCKKAEKSVVMYELLGDFKNFIEDEQD